MRERLIGIDAGGTMTKAALFDVAGHELASERRANQMLFPAPGHTERDPDRMWKAACEAVASLLERTGTAPDEVVAVSAAGYGSGLYLIDRNGDPVRPGIVSTDSRASGLVAEWERTGVAGVIAQAVQQRVWPGQSIALLAWLDRYEPGVLERTHSVAFCKDFLRARLCGDISTDPTDGGIAGAMNITAGTYAEEAFRAAGLSRWMDRMPEIRPVCEVVGAVTDGTARVTGLKAGTPVVRGAVDVTAALSPAV
jgi:L-xylulokinase